MLEIIAGSKDANMCLYLSENDHFKIKEKILRRRTKEYTLEELEIEKGVLEQIHRFRYKISTLHQT